MMAHERETWLLSFLALILEGRRVALCCLCGKGEVMTGVKSGLAWAAVLFVNVPIVSCRSGSTPGSITTSRSASNSNVIAPAPVFSKGS
eukprot:CAMPEP_0179118038 /NCGR_PEP_ID=MMETSP0796-20121207/55481_1 /TAXON_ID=73915 /ORGANISM="Pyrodinium bahamense, Strain pbaha01" /LENGTH=88 /DNA_ID=CAMNT_0020816451 /DNA_START=1257 /DNA_END=1520 /DNA_ORIENTATION=+